MKGDPSRLADFKKRDANHDGVVTKEEAIAYGREHGIANKIMREADKNHDASSIGQKCRPTTRAGKVPPLNLINLATWD